MKKVNKKTQHYVTFPKIIPLEVGLKFISDVPLRRQDRDYISGFLEAGKVGRGSIRLVTFKTKGTQCYICKLKATHFLLQHTNPGVENAPYHMNLYAYDVLFTRDHVIPVSRGGKDTLENNEPCCTLCNTAKKHFPLETILIDRQIKSVKAGGISP